MVSNFPELSACPLTRVQIDSIISFIQVYWEMFYLQSIICVSRVDSEKTDEERCKHSL